MIKKLVDYIYIYNQGSLRMLPQGLPWQNRNPFCERQEKRTKERRVIVPMHDHYMNSPLVEYFSFPE
jgi:hypothetical protein